MAPILAVVVILGFAIGGVISLLGHRGSDAASTLSTPLPATSAVPSVASSEEAPVTPEPSPSPSPSLAPTPKPTASHAPLAVVTPLRATPEPSASPVPPASTPAPVESASAAPASAAPASAKPASPRPALVAKPEATAKAVAAAPPARAASPAPVKAATAAPVNETADSDFARQAASVVRGYLTALARGDDAAAQAVLDAPTGSREASLTEKEFAGPDMRISDIEAHGTGDSARVDVDLQTAKGAYFAQFFLKKSASGAPLIVNHDFIKP